VLLSCSAWPQKWRTASRMLPAAVRPVPQASQASHRTSTVQPRALHARTASPLPLPFIFPRSNPQCRHFPPACCVRLRLPRPPFGDKRVRDAGAADHHCHTVSSVPAPARHISGNSTHQRSTFKTSHHHSQLSDLEAARVIVLSHYHIGTHAPQRSALVTCDSRISQEFFRIMFARRSQCLLQARASSAWAI
jgi:hypothetical protein